MNKKESWSRIQTDDDYEIAMARYQEIRKAKKGDESHAEKLNLIEILTDYEKEKYPLINSKRTILSRLESLKGFLFG